MPRLLLALAMLALFCAPVEAAEPIRLASRPALSPDGSTLAFSWMGDLWTVPSTGGVARRLTAHPATDGEPFFSPDGREIAFVSDRENGRRVWVIPAQGGAPEPITHDTNGCTLEGWFPGGTALLIRAPTDRHWRRSNRFFRVERRGRAAPTMLFDAECDSGRVTHDGSRVLFAREGVEWWRKGYTGPRSAQIWSWEFATGAFTKLREEAGGARWPRPLPDGGWLYVSQASGSFNLWRARSGGKDPVQLTEFPDDAVVMPAVSRDGSTIVFRHRFDFYRLTNDDAAPKKLEITFEADGVVPAPIQREEFKSATAATFTDDGLEIAFVAGGDVWVMDTVLREPKRVTNTPEEEREPTFSPDGKTILFVSDTGGRCDVWTATRADEKAYWWQNDAFTLTRLTDDEAEEMAISWSPQGDRIAYARERGDLWTMKADGAEPKRLLASFNVPRYDWSPDGAWLVYSHEDDDFNRDVWLLKTDGSGTPYNLSRHPDNDSTPVWSPDGKTIAWTAKRFDDEWDVVYVRLREEDDEESKRDRTLEEALEKMKKERKPKKPTKKPEPAKDDGNDGDEKPPAKEDEDEKPADEREGEEKPDAKEEKPEKPKTPPVEIDFDRLHERIRRLAIPNSYESGLVFSHDSKKLGFRATVSGKSGFYTVEFPDELTPKHLSSTSGSGARWIKKGLVWLAGGKPATLSDRGKAESYAFVVRTTVDRREKFRAAFDLCWRAMRDHFYDGRMNNRDWDAVREKYREAAANAPSVDRLRVIVSLMLGELNGSHLGFSAGGPSAPSPHEWPIVTGHVGARWDPSHAGPGRRIADVVEGSPASLEKSRLHPNEIVLSIDGTAIDRRTDMTTVLNGRLDRFLRLRVKDEKGAERDVEIQAVRLPVIQRLLYEEWLRAQRKHVDEASKGSLGYVHIRGMNWSSFLRFETEIYAQGAGKDGLIIDVRDNGGGFTTDHLLTILTQPRHAITVPRGGGRGYPQDRFVYATWSKPIVVLCNQNSFSNAEIFAHAIKTLGRGQLVGVTTAGGVISTGGRRIMDIGFLRMPFRGWYLVGSGEDMERAGAVPHHIVWPEPADFAKGLDRQLDKAIEVLGADVAKWKARKETKLRKASDR